MTTLVPRHKLPVDIRKMSSFGLTGNVMQKHSILRKVLLTTLCRGFRGAQLSFTAPYGFTTQSHQEVVPPGQLVVSG